MAQEVSVNLSDLVARDLERRDDVRRAVASDGPGDVRILIDNGTDLGPIRRGYRVVEIRDFDSVAYVIVELDVEEWI